MKKLFSVIAVLLTLSTASIFAKTGVGLQGGATIGNAIGGTGAVTVKPSDRLPWVFAITVPSFNPFAIGLTADYWIDTPTFSRNFGWYYGVGLAAAFYTGDPGLFGFGARAVVGIQGFLLNKFLELYAEIAWQPMFFISGGFHTQLLAFPINLGFRFWF
ncbi:MAG: hypothetical protein J6X54_01650 [Treponema sp.]|nr:hypothetical protein [Treponema sp.]